MVEKRFFKNSFLFLILLSLVLSIPSISLGEKHWADNEINYLVDKDIMKGYEDGTFRPDKEITRAEFVKVINNVFGYTEKAQVSFSDVKESDWYYEDIQRGVAAGYIGGYSDGTMKPNKAISRQEAAKIISLVYELADESTVKIEYEDENEVDPWAREYVNAVRIKGIMKGYADGSFKPKSNITRGEVAKVISIASGDIYNEKGEYTQNAKGNVVVNTPDVKLKNMTIDGDLYLAEGIGNGDVILQDVIVKGKFFVRGGGENSIHIINSKIDKLFVNKKSDKVRIILKDNSVVSNIVAEKNSIIVIGEGTKVDKLKINGNVKLVVEKGAEVSEVEVKSKNVEIVSEGKIEKIIAKEEVKVNDKIVEKGKEVKTDGKKVEEISKDKPKEDKPKQPKDEERPEKPDKPETKYSFEAKLNKNEYNLDENITISGTVLKDNIALPDVDITLKLIKKDGTIPPLTVEQLKTDKDGKFISTFKVPEGTEVGEYLLVVKANEPVDESLKIDLKVLEEFSSIYVFKAEIDKKEYTVDEDIVLSGTVLKENKGLADVDITLKLIGEEDKELLLTVDQFKTDKDGKFTYTFKIPEGTNIGEYILIVKANEPIDEKIECNLTISNRK